MNGLGPLSGRRDGDIEGIFADTGAGTARSLDTSGHRGEEVLGPGFLLAGVLASIHMQEAGC